MTMIDGKPTGRHRVAVLALPGVVLGDLAVPVEVLGQPHIPLPYDVVVCAETSEVPTRSLALQVPHDLDVMATADTVIVPGVDDVVRPPSTEVREALCSVVDRGARVASICTGAFVLAAAGLLHGKTATTHWAAAQFFAERFVDVTVDPDVLFVDEGQVLTSAGAAAGFDLCLHLIRKDLGADVAAQVARMAVMAPERPGGQAQFIQPAAPQHPDALAPVLVWLEENLQRTHTLASMAAAFHLSPRTLHRRFKAQLGTTPLQWLTSTRVRRAQALLEDSDLGVEHIADAVGFGSAVTFRQRFAAQVGTSPTAYRSSFRSTTS